MRLCGCAVSADASLLTMCDMSLGRVLDAFDEHSLWDDTMLLVHTDHGFLMGAPHALPHAAS